ncbi:hypothetical protein CR513_38848, partial [Mucuna pruriens]
MYNKKKLEGFEVVNLTKDCFVVVLKKFPPKLNDTWCFTIPCTMDNFEKALTITHPLDIVEDVLVKVREFIFPADFVILNMDENDEVIIIFVIDAEKGKLTLRLCNEEAYFKVSNSHKILSSLVSWNCVQILDISMGQSQETTPT